MNDSHKTKKQLINELSQIRQELAAVSTSKNTSQKVTPESIEPDNIFYKAFLSSPDMFIIADPTNGTYVEVNDSFVKNTGYSREELIGHSVGELNLWVHQEERDKMSRLLTEHGKLTNEEFSFRMKSGEIRQWLCAAETVNMGGAERMIAVATDITERKQVEDALRTSEEEFRTLFETMAQGVVYQEKTGEVISMNPAAESILGMKLEKLKNPRIINTNLKTIREDGSIYPAEEHPTMVSLKTGKPVKDAIMGIYNTEEDNYKWIIINTVPQFRPGEDEPYRVFVTFNDITERKRMEENLRYHADLMQNVSDAIVSTDLEHKIISWNRAAELKYGWREDEVIGRKMVDILKPEYPNKKIEDIMKTLRKDGIWRGEAIHETKGGEKLNVLVSTSLIKDEEGDNKGAVTFFTDITEQKQEEERHRTILRTTLDGVWTVDLKGKFIEVNDAYCNMVGYTREELQNMSIMEIEAVETPEDILQRIDKIITEGGDRFETKHKRKDGRIIDVDISTNYLDIGEGQLSVFVRDITERKATEKALRESEERFSKAFRSSPDRVVISTLNDGKVVDVNDSYLRYTGYRRDDVIGHTMIELGSWVNPEQRIKIIQNLKKHGKVENEEVELRNKSGEIRNSIFSAELINIDGEQCMISIATDITERKHAEEALRESEEKFSRAFHASSNLVSITRIKDHVILDINEAYAQLSGYSREELIGRSTRDLKLWADPELRKKASTQLDQNGKVRHMEVKLQAKSGDIRTILLSTDMVYLKGEPCLLTTGVDVTERKEVEEALKENEERYRLIADNANDLISRIQMIPEISTDYVSPSCLRITGYRQEDFYKDRNLGLQMIHPDDQDLFLKHIRSGNKNQQPLIVRLVRKDGQVIWIEQTHTAISNDKGETVAMHLIARDITERKRAEEALRESEVQLKGILKAAPIGIALIQDRIPVWVNDHFCTMTGYSEQELVGKNSRKLYTSYEEYLRVNELKNRAIEFSGKGEVETQFVCKNGDIRDILIVSTPLDPDNQSAGTIATMMDITERKKAEEHEREAKNLRELDRLRTELLANVSHELRTPLASIKGFTTVLTDYDNKLTPEEKREYLEIIDHNTDRLSELIEQLLVISRLGSGMLTIDRSPSDIKTLCEEVISEAKIRSPEFNFIHDLPARLPKVYIDTKRIRQVLDNLIDNAVKHSFPGTEISITASRKNNEIVVTVTDEGTGISRKDRPYIFDRMFHTQRKHKSGATGAGLGLSICKGLIEAHQGRIWIESEEGKGTRCFFTLPTYNNRGVRHGKKEKGEYHSVHRG